MFIVIYTFKVKPCFEEEFQTAWSGLTLLFLEHAGSLGSTLHTAGEGLFVAYAQWPDKTTWEKASTMLPPEAEEYRKQMRNSCLAIDTKYELQTVVDLLKK